jgi:hypothetical protein
MPYPTIDEFKRIISTTSLQSVVQQHIFQGTPYVFRERPENYQLLTQHLCTAIGLLEDNLTIVGSAKIGFSLNPDNFPRQFSEVSDIDVIIVSEKLFDMIWMTLLEWHYPRRLSALGRVEGEWARLRRREIYWGFLVPTEIHYDGISFPHVLKPIRDVSVKWFNAFRGFSLYPEFAARTVSGRLYRTWEHALQYHMEGLRLVRDKIRTLQRGG